MHLYLQASTIENFNKKHRFLQKCLLNTIIFLSFSKSVSEIYNNPTLTSRKGGAGTKTGIFGHLWTRIKRLLSSLTFIKTRIIDMGGEIVWVVHSPHLIIYSVPLLYQYGNKKMYSINGLNLEMSHMYF